MSEPQDPELTAQKEQGDDSAPGAEAGQREPAAVGQGAQWDDHANSVVAEREAAEDEDADEDGAADPTRDRWAAPEQREVLKKALESLVFVSDRIVTHVQLARVVNARAGLVRTVLREIIDDTADRGVQLVEVSGGYQYRTSPDTGIFVRELVSQKPVRLSRAQLETLALVAYRQPITRPEVDEVRGVDTGSAIKVLLDRGLIKMIGRKDEAGRPLLYGTTPYFLEFFGLSSLRDLPTLKEFTELSDDSRTLFKRKTGETVEQAQTELAQLAGDGAEEDAVEEDGDDDAKPANQNEEGGDDEASPAIEDVDDEGPDDEAGPRHPAEDDEVDLDKLDLDSVEDDFK